MLHIEFARRQRHWSQEKLGQRVGITQAFISLIELGRGVPRAEEAQRLAHELGLTREILLTPVVVLTSQITEAEAVKLAAAQRVQRARTRVAKAEADVRELETAGVKR